MEKTRKAERYLRIYGQLRKLLAKTSDPQARISTICAVLHHKFDHYFWTGYYRILKDSLVVACYQGPVACLVLTPHTGVCWACIDKEEIVIVPDVNAFPGHIACDSRSLSEICIPVFESESNIKGVFDVDSRELEAFDEIDAEWLEKITKMVYHL